MSLQEQFTTPILDDRGEHLRARLPRNVVRRHATPRSAHHVDGDRRTSEITRYLLRFGNDKLRLGVARDRHRRGQQRILVRRPHLRSQRRANATAVGHGNARVGYCVDRHAAERGVDGAPLALIDRQEHEVLPAQVHVVGTGVCHEGGRNASRISGGRGGLLEVEQRPGTSKQRQVKRRGVIGRRGRGDRRVEADLGLTEQLRRGDFRTEVDGGRTHAFAQKHEAVAGVGGRLSDQLDAAYTRRHLGVRPSTKVRLHHIGRPARRGQRAVDRRRLIGRTRTGSVRRVGQEPTRVVVEVGHAANGVGELVDEQPATDHVARVGALEVGDGTVHEQLRVGGYEKRGRGHLAGIHLLEGRKVGASGRPGSDEDDPESCKGLDAHQYYQTMLMVAVNIRSGGVTAWSSACIVVPALFAFASGSRPP